ncbi:MAG: universal stress protein [Desulfomonile tiedjei]|uniref:Universal stress protein n=1 Tax=Desulfomonile tiedjei TaxID=2358 RepID=A0A9D6V6C5_9BACT|nr:universal stress protein [Desulfomonile tiedjei]
MIPSKILVCTDFSENSVRARILAIEYARVFKAELILLHVVNSRLLGYPTFADRIPLDMALVQQNIEEGVTEELELLANDCRRDLADVRGYSRSGAPAEEIVRFADEESVGLIVMGTHGWTGVKHLILGSTAENVVRTANCPVLTVRAKSA